MRKSLQAHNVPLDQRDLWVADDEQHVILTLDYSQIEARLTAFDAKDKEMTELFLSGGDVHTTSAVALYGGTEEEAHTLKVMVEGQWVTRRQGGKKFRHMYNYGARPPRIAEALDIPESEARRLAAADDARWPATAHWRRATAWRALETHRVVNPFGRVREFWEPPLRDRMTGEVKVGWGGLPEWSEAREAVAQWPQSTADDMRKFAMAAVPIDLLWTTTHDSIGLHVAVGDEVRVARLVKGLMERRFDEMVWSPYYPLGFWCPVEAKVGYRWGEERKLEL